MSEFKIKAEMSGSVWKIQVKEGQKVEEEDVLIIMESMKMEIPIEAPEKGTIKKINVNEGDLISDGDELIVLNI